MKTIIMRKCRECPTEFPVEVDPEDRCDPGTLFYKFCDACLERHQREASEEELRTVMSQCDLPRGLLEPWDDAKGCAPAFRDAVLAWRPTVQRGLLIHGPNQTCKSRLACRLALELAKHYRRSARFAHVPLFEGKMAPANFRNLEALASELIRPPILILDDYGDKEGHEKVYKLLLQVIEDRRQSLSKITLITSNLAPGQATWNLQHMPKALPFVRAIDTRIESAFNVIAAS